MDSSWDVWDSLSMSKLIPIREGNGACHALLWDLRCTSPEIGPKCQKIGGPDFIITTFLVVKALNGIKRF